MRKALWIRTAVIVSAVGGLELACRSGRLPDTLIVAPTAMVGTLYEVLRSGELAGDMRQTFTAVASAAVLAIAGGFFLGFSIHSAPRLRRVVDPLLAAYYAVPHFAFYPLLIVIFGLGMRPLIVLATLFGIAAMIIGTLDGLDRVPRTLLRTARVHRLNTAQELMLIRLPAAAPHLLSGVKLAFAYSFIGVIAGEFILSTTGIGHQIAFAYDNFDNRRMYALIIFVIGLVATTNMLLFWWERRMAARRGIA